MIEVNEVLREIRKKESSEDLLLCVEQMDKNEDKPNIFESACLQMTLNQIDKGWQIMARENFRNNEDILSYLATENLKDNIKNGWSKFIAALKAFLNKLKEKLKILVEKIKKLVGGKGSTSSPHVEEVTEDGEPIKPNGLGGSTKSLPAPGKDSTTTKQFEKENQEGTNKIKVESELPTAEWKLSDHHWKLKRAFYSFGDSSNKTSAGELAQWLGKISDITIEIRNIYLSEETKNALSLSNEDWLHYLKTSEVKVVNIIKQLGDVKTEGKDYVIKVSDYLELRFGMLDEATGKVDFPRLLITNEEMGVITFSGKNEVFDLQKVTGMAAWKNSEVSKQYLEFGAGKFQLLENPDPVQQNRIIRLESVLRGIVSLPTRALGFIDVIYSLINMAAKRFNM